MLEPQIVLSLEDSPATRALWPHPFRLRYSVHQMPDRLVCVLRAHNPGPRAFSFAASLDSHLAVIDPAGAHVIGLNGVKYVARTQLNRNWKVRCIHAGVTAQNLSDPLCRFMSCWHSRGNHCMRLFLP